MSPEYQSPTALGKAAAREQLLRFLDLLPHIGRGASAKGAQTVTLIHRLRDDIEGRKRRRNESEPVEQVVQQSKPEHEENGWRRTLNGARQFWRKASNDWIFNLSAMLAYNLLMSIFPILLVLIAAAGFVLNFISPGSQQQLINAIAGLFPKGAAGQESTGQTIVTAALHSLAQSAGLMLAIGLVTAAVGGSRLFISIENCFSVIFRLRPRNALRQNIMALTMLLLYIVLIPIIFLASSFASAVARILFLAGANVVTGLLIRGAGILIALVVALVLFAAIYVVVPNRPVHIKEVWRGTLAGAALLILYELVFPIYQSLFLKPNNYGSLAGFAILILVFFYYFAFILLLGAEVNSWASGQRQTSSDISGIIHEMQAHDTTRGAAALTAGTRTDDPQNDEGKAAMTTNTQAIYHERVQEKRERPQQPRKNGGAGVVAILATAALSALMWFLGRTHRHA